MKALDLFCGAGGATKGLQRAGFYVVGVDINPQPRYCGNEFIQADALTFPLDGYDLIWSSPPCQGYIQRNKNLETKHPKLIEPIRQRLSASGTPYVIENVPGAPLLSPITLCGTSFDLKVLRHRIFESVFFISQPSCAHKGTVSQGDYAAVYAFGGRGPRRGRGLRDGPPTKPGPGWSDLWELTG